MPQIWFSCRVFESLNTRVLPDDLTHVNTCMHTLSAAAAVGLQLCALHSMAVQYSEEAWEAIRGIRLIG